MATSCCAAFESHERPLVIPLDYQQAADQRAYGAALKRWLIRDMARLYGDGDRAHTQEMPHLLMACPLWGERYVERFRTWCLPSILAPQNQAALLLRARIVLFTDPDTLLDLCDLRPTLERHGIDLRLWEIPADVVDGLNRGENKYFALGAAGQIGIQMARRWGMAFHQLQPDVVYNEQWFPRLFELAEKYPAIAQWGLSADIDSAATALGAYRKGDALIIPDRELGAIGFRHLHAQQRSLTMNVDGIHRHRMPAASWLGWIGKETYTIHCPHLNISYLSRELCQRARPHLPHTVETLLPELMPDGCHVPDAREGLTMIEVSGAEKPAMPAEGYGPVAGYADAVWQSMRYRADYLPFLRRTCRVWIGPHDEAAWTDAQIDQEFRGIFDEVVAHRTAAMEGFIARAQGATG